MSRQDCDHVVHLHVLFNFCIRRNIQTWGHHIEGIVAMSDNTLGAQSNPDSQVPELTSPACLLLPPPATGKQSDHQSVSQVVGPPSSKQTSRQTGQYLVWSLLDIGGVDRLSEESQLKPADSTQDTKISDPLIPSTKTLLGRTEM